MFTLTPPAKLGIAVFDPNAHTLAVTCSKFYSIHLWDVRLHGEANNVEDVCVATLALHTGTIKSLAFSTKGFLVSASMDKTCRVWDTKNKFCIAILTHGVGVFAAAFSPKGDQIVTSCMKGKILLWLFEPDKSACALQKSFNTDQKEEMKHVSFSTGSNKAPVFVCGGKSLQAFNASTNHFSAALSYQNLGAATGP